MKILLLILIGFSISVQAEDKKQLEKEFNIEVLNQESFQSNGFKINSLKSIPKGSSSYPQSNYLPTSYLEVLRDNSVPIYISSNKNDGMIVGVQGQIGLIDSNNDGVFDWLNYESSKNSDGWIISVTDYEMDGVPDTRYHRHDTKEGFHEVWYLGSWHRLTKIAADKYEFKIKEKTYSAKFVKGRLIVTT